MRLTALKQNLGPVSASVVLHGAILALLTLGFSFSGPASLPPQVTVKAKVVSEQQIRDELAALEAQDREEERRREEERDRLRREAEQERRRLAEIQAQRSAAEQREKEREAAAEQERQRVARAERERKEREAAEQARLAELARQRKAEEERLARIREEQRQAEEARRKEEERRRAEQAARERAEREAELREQIALERQRREAEEAGLLGQYIALIQQRVTRSWLRPPEAQPGLNCEVFVSQIPGGEVVDVRIGRCNGSGAVQRSIEAAVYRASPLPPPPDPSLFERNLVFEFRPEDRDRGDPDR